MTIGVVMPLYNNAATVGDALRSVLAQTRGADSIAVVDDGSDDCSVSIVEAMADDKIKLLRCPHRGVSAARNEGMMALDTDLVAFIDADDLWDRNHLAQIEETAVKWPFCGLYATGYRLMYPDGHMKEIDVPEGCHEAADYFRLAVQGMPPVWTSAAAVRRKAAIEAGGFDSRVTVGEDLLMWARLAICAPVAIAGKSSACYRLRQSHMPGQSSSRDNDNPDWVGLELASLLPADREDNTWGMRYLAHWHRMRCSNALAAGHVKEAGDEARQSLRLNPRQWKVWIMLVLALMPEPVYKAVGRMRIILSGRCTGC